MDNEQLWTPTDGLGLEVRIAKTPTNGIDAGAFSDVSYYQSSSTATLNNTSSDFSVLNPFTFPILGDTYITCHRVDGVWVVSSEPHAELIFISPEGGIPARSGTTAGSAACVPYYIGSSAVITELLDTSGASQTLTVYNISASAVAGSKYITAKTVRGVYVVDMEDCG
jgi:hypothetical protein